jgi:hypothetical protein
MAKSKLLIIPPHEEVELERIQTGIRMEKRLMKVLRATADYKDLPLGGLLSNQPKVMRYFLGQSLRMCLTA